MDTLRYKLFMQASARLKMIGTISALLLIPIIYAFVYVTGGIQYVYSHTMYFPILIMAFLYGYKGGLIIAVIAGIALGPLMPIDVVTGQDQVLFNWLYRMLIFVLVGCVMGIIFDQIRIQIRKHYHLFVHFPDSNIPNYYYYKEHYESLKAPETQVMFTLQIKNYDELATLLGRDAYIEVLKELYAFLVDILPDLTPIIQVDWRRFWFHVDKDEYASIDKVIFKQLEDHVIYSKALPLYIDYILGVSHDDTDKLALERFKDSDLAALYALKINAKKVLYSDDQLFDRATLELLGNLPFALKNNELFLEYQPITDLNTKEVIKFEALIRWRRNGKIVEPRDFIPIAEETRVIDQITEWVLNKVIEDIPDFKAINKNVSIAMNLAQRNLFNPELIELLVKRINDCPELRGSIHMEITESSAMLNYTVTKMLLKSLRQAGVSTVLDDFGTGYSSLAFLQELPFDVLKIDRLFINRIDEDIKRRQLTKLIIDLAHHLGLKVVAEGVEKKEISEVLEDLGCDYGQGFYYQRPIEKSKALKWLKENTL